MRWTYGLIPLACGIVMAALGILAILDVLLLGIWKEDDCNSRCAMVSGCCTVWKKPFCWQGTLDKGTGQCKQKGIVSASIVLVLGLLSIGIGIAWVARADRIDLGSAY